MSSFFSLLFWFQAITFLIEGFLYWYRIATMDYTLLVILSTLPAGNTMKCVGPTSIENFNAFEWK